MAGSKGEKTITTKSEQTSGPSPMAVPYLNDLYKAAGEALNSKQPFTGEVLAPTSGTTSTGLDWIKQLAAPGGMIGQGAGDFLNMAQATARGDFLNPASNPWLAQTAQAAISPLQKQFTDIVLPGITDQAIAQGAYGGARQDVQQNNAANQLTRATGDITATIFGNNYQQERARQMGAGDLLGTGYGLAAAPGRALVDVGGQETAITQNILNNALQKFMLGRENAFYGLGDVANVLTAGGYGTKSGTMVGVNPNYETSGAQTAKMLMGGLGLAGSLFSAPMGGTSAASGFLNFFK